MKEKLMNGLRAVGKGVAGLFKMLPFHKLKGNNGLKWGLVAALVLILLMVGLMFYMGQMPEAFDVRAQAASRVTDGGEMVVGVTTTATLIHVAESMLDKPGGYLSNDVLPPSVFMDNVPSWEWGVLVQVRDMSRALRNDISRSRSQSIEVDVLAEAETSFHIDNTSWIFPRSEARYRDGIEALDVYLKNLSAENQPNAQFYARADNLRDWLMLVEKRLGSLSQRLSASVGQNRINTDLGGASGAVQSTYTAGQQHVKTPWLEIDNVFYEARGSAWALLHLLKAIEVDFKGVLEKKNATVLVSQIIRELEGTQHSLSSPMVLNGSPFGFFANHSLVMASYVSRANAAVIELRELLSQG